MYSGCCEVDTVMGKNFAGEIFRGLTDLVLFRREKFRGRRHVQFRGIYKIYPIGTLLLLYAHTEALFITYGGLALLYYVIPTIHNRNKNVQLRWL